jgi:hypothetical protein
MVQKKRTFMQAFCRNLRSVAALWLAVPLFSGCGATTVTPVFPTSDTLARPDRVLVHDFAVTLDESEIGVGVGSWTSGGVGSTEQAQDDIRVGKSFAKALTDNLVAELRRRGINAYRASEAAPPGENTASIKGRFLRTNQNGENTLVGFDLGSGQVRTHMWILQGAELRSGVVAEGDTVTRTDLRPGLGPMLSAMVEAGAKQTAAQVAERIVDYYKRRGWIK